MYLNVPQCNMVRGCVILCMMFFMLAICLSSSICLSSYRSNCQPFDIISYSSEDSILSL